MAHDASITALASPLLTERNFMGRDIALPVSLNMGWRLKVTARLSVAIFPVLFDFSYFVCGATS